MQRTGQRQRIAILPVKIICPPFGTVPYPPIRSIGSFLSNYLPKVTAFFMLKAQMGLIGLRQKLSLKRVTSGMAFTAPAFYTAMEHITVFMA